MTGQLSGAAARAALGRGVAAVADAVGVTLGPGGRQVVLGTADGPVVTADGAAVAEAVELPDPYENLGARLVREAAGRTREVAGDGAATTVVLAGALFAAGLRAVTAGADPLAVRRGMAAAAGAADGRLAAAARPLAGEQEAAVVAGAAAGDREWGELIARACAKAGAHGAVTVEEAHVPDLEAEFGAGVRLEQGLLSPLMVTHPEQGAAVLEDAYLLLHPGQIGGVRELLPVLDKVAATGRPLLVVAGGIGGEALSALVMNRLRGTLLCAAIAAPALGERRRAHVEDLAALTGGEVVAPEAGLPLEQVGLGQLGRAARVVATKSGTTVTGGAGSATVVEARVRQLEYARTGAAGFDREVLGTRLARLTGGVCVLKVGAPTDAESAERARRVTAAVAATRAAMADGVVSGGGCALAAAAPPLSAAAGDERAGALAVRDALAAPARRIAANSGPDGAHIAARLAGLPAGHGWDAATRTFRDLAAAGVLDPVRVPRTALAHAVSVAGLLLTAGGLVVDRRPADPDAVSWRRRGHGHHHGHGHSHGHHHH
ncbi:chaperonin GroEL [Streptomyces boninensis]|uniref:chaperonin GroEL n=1 Tax=Streptomyces boninensis TaxID=2039455 RepID=UPI003B226303